MLLKQPIVIIDGPCGGLETIVLASKTKPIKGVAIILHPNPLEGGTNLNKVVQIAAKAFINQAYDCYLPNLRGVGASEGQHDFGVGEVDDVMAVVNYIKQQYADIAITLAGFSFGGYVASKAAHRYQFNKLILIAPAVSRYQQVAPNIPENLTAILIHGEQDEVVLLTDLFTWARPQNLSVTVVLAAGHFFHGKLIILQAIIQQMLK